MLGGGILLAAPWHLRNVVGRTCSRNMQPIWLGCGRFCHEAGLEKIASRIMWLCQFCGAAKSWEKAGRQSMETFSLAGKSPPCLLLACFPGTAIMLDIPLSAVTALAFPLLCLLISVMYATPQAYVHITCTHHMYTSHRLQLIRCLWMKKLISWQTVPCKACCLIAG